MRTVVSLVCSTLLASPVLADAPAPGAPAHKSRAPAVILTPLVADEIPEPCRPLAKQVMAGNLLQAMTTRISLAGCIADRELAGLTLIDGGESVLAVETATERSFAMLDEVIAAGDPTLQLLAGHAKGELYTGMRVRMLSTIPPAQATAESIAMRDARKAVLDAQLEPWSERAREAFERVVAIAKANPRLLKNPVIQSAVRTSEQRLAPAQVAAS